jgi:hypothetical protein
MMIFRACIALSALLITAAALIYAVKNQPQKFTVLDKNQMVFFDPRAGIVYLFKDGGFLTVSLEEKPFDPFAEELAERVEPKEKPANYSAIFPINRLPLNPTTPVK